MPRVRTWLARDRRQVLSSRRANYGVAPIDRGARITYFEGLLTNVKEPLGARAHSAANAGSRRGREVYAPIGGSARAAAHGLPRRVRTAERDPALGAEPSGSNRRWRSSDGGAPVRGPRTRRAAL